MANCPKCNEHLKITDWKQHCPHCGANIVLYDIQERLMQDADKAEVQYFSFHKKVVRMKAAFVGSKLAIARIVTSIIPLLAVVIPFVKGSFKEPFAPFDGVFSLFTLIDSLENFNVDGILELLNTPDGKTAVLFFVGALALFALSIVLILVHLICIIMACGKRGKQRNYCFDILMLVFAVIGSVLLMAAPENPYFDIQMIFAPIVYIILLAVNFGVDIAVFKQGIEIKYDDCFVGGIPAEEYFKMVEDGVPQAEIRQEMYRRLTLMQEEKMKEVSK